MPATVKRQIKRATINLGIYKYARNFYDRFIDQSRLTELRHCVELYKNFVRAGDLCFDVGANVGRKTAALLELGARVVAVEPQPECQRELECLFGGHPNFKLIPKAVGSEATTAKMYLSENSALSSLNQNWFHKWDTEIDVELTTLDAIIAEHGMPRFCKIDVEGHELEALKGLSRQPEVVGLEYKLENIDRTLACLDQLLPTQQGEINITLRENNHLQWDQWCRGEEFPDRFRKELEKHPDSYWGDLFIRAIPAKA